MYAMDPSRATSLSKTSFTDREDRVRADNLAHGGVVQAIQMGVCRSLSVWLIKYASKFQNRRRSSIEGDRTTDGQKGRRDSITFGDIQPRLTSLRRQESGWSGAESNGNCSVFSYPDWYFHFSAHRNGMGETLEKEYSESIQREITKP